jgi:hypothetical protein
MPYFVFFRRLGVLLQGRGITAGEPSSFEVHFL